MKIGQKVYFTCFSLLLVEPGTGPSWSLLIILEFGQILSLPKSQNFIIFNFRRSKRDLSSHFVSIEERATKSLKFLQYHAHVPIFATLKDSNYFRYSPKMSVKRWPPLVLYIEIRGLIWTQMSN